MKGQGALIMVIVGAMLGIIMLGYVLVPVVTQVLASLNSSSDEYTIWAVLPILIPVAALMLVVGIIVVK